MDFLNKVINEDCLEFIPKLPHESIDLIVTSPPYNVKEFYRGEYDNYDDDKEHEEYLALLKNVFGSVKGKLVSGGRICINVGDGRNGAIPTHSDIIQFMTKELGYIIITTIVWDKKNCSARTAWGSFKSPSAPSFPTPFEYILVFAKDNRKLQKKGSTDLTKEEFIEWSQSLWFLPAKCFTETTKIINKGIHPAPFPIEIPLRCIKMFSWVGAVVMDPFSGYGTTACAAKITGRDYVAVDRSKNYCEKSQKRINNLVITDGLF